MHNKNRLQQCQDFYAGDMHGQNLLSIITLRFLAPMPNVNASILKLSLGGGFNIISMSEQEAIQLLSLLENERPFVIAKLLYMHYPLLNIEERKVYFVESSIGSDIEKKDGDTLTVHFSKLANFENQKVHGYLIPKLRLVRLFKAGNVCIPFWYFYEIGGGAPGPLMGHTIGLVTVARETLTIEDSELPSLSEYLQETEIPFNQPYQQLAMENFEASYESHSEASAFLTLMMCLETLFNPGKDELMYRISRNIAVLLGKDKNESREIFARMKNLYGIRSEILHRGKSETLKHEDVLELRQLCREAIKRAIRLDMTKDELANVLNQAAFGKGESQD